MADDTRGAFQRALRDLNLGLQALLGSGPVPGLLARDLLADSDPEWRGAPPPRAGSRLARRGGLPRRTRSGLGLRRRGASHLSLVQ